MTERKIASNARNGARPVPSGNVVSKATGTLTPNEFERLVQVVAKLAAQRVSIIYVSHKMDEVFRVCRTATILRDGRVVDDVVMAETSEAAVVARMVGRGSQDHASAVRPAREEG